MEHTYTNELINETSPYLLQHAHNPVNWHAWHDAAWQKAKQEDKLAIISIGYSACHWCHVMEHESFEDTAVAQLMNDNFICIKVDREERPDVDQIYMDACQLITGSGGWPLNAIVLPDGRPLYVGTYFPKENWKQVLAYFVDYWKNHKDEAYERAAQITNGIRTMDTIDAKPKPEFVESDRRQIFEKMSATIDYTKGGRSGAPKFPMPVNYEYLLQNYYYTNNNTALKAVTVTLNNMMDGGIYDHVGGGFARYSVDANWEIPHFEKMLYDNAQLVSLYSHAYQITNNERYKEVVYETLDFIGREMTDTSGGLYSALDADSEGEEGKYYVWSYDELKQILGADFNEFATVFNVSEHGNFEGLNNLTRTGKDDTENPKLKEWKTKLLAVRGKRIAPGLDDKILTSWNALMLKGYLDAYNAFGEKRFLDSAISVAMFLKNNMIQADGTIKRNYKNGKTTISGFLDDYSFTCEAYIALYQTTFDEQWLSTTKQLADHAIQHFYNFQTGLFFYTSVNDAPLIARKTESSDNVIPSSNSSMAKALYALGLLYDNEDYILKSKKAINAVKDNILQHPSFYANWAILSNWLITPPYEVAISGTELLNLRKQFGLKYLPGCIYTGSAANSGLPLLQDKYKAGETLIYVCHNNTCQLPVKHVNDALLQIK